MITIQKKSTLKLFFYSSLFLLPFLCIISLLIGSSSVSFDTLINGLLFKDNHSTEIIYGLRLPRLILTILAGITLSTSGFLMQTVSQNKLVSPSMIGITDGALLGVVLSQFLNVSIPFFTPIASILGALVAVSFVYIVAILVPGGFIKTRFILIGIIISSIIGSLSNLLSIHLSFFQEINLFFLGSVSNARWWDVYIITFSIIISIIPLIYLLGQLDGFYLSEELLYSLGKPVKFIKILSFITATILSAVTISTVGKINFIGLIVPNIVYFFKVISPRKQFFLNIIISILFMLIADILSKIVRYPYETQISFIISFIGIPFFFYIIKKQGGLNG